jgi:hypothetical protein
MASAGKARIEDFNLRIMNSCPGLKDVFHDDSSSMKSSRWRFHLKGNGLEDLARRTIRNRSARDALPGDRNREMDHAETLGLQMICQIEPDRM